MIFTCLFSYFCFFFFFFFFFSSRRRHTRSLRDWSSDVCSSDLVFIGMVPAENPRLVGLVMIDEPKGKEYYGGQVAGPVFSNVMRLAVRQLQLAPDGTPLTSTAAAPVREPRT